jgi:hypothetical protein
MSTLRGTADIRSLLDDFAATPAILAQIATGVGDDDLDAARQGEWSARTVIAHLRDDEFMVMRLRLERMLVENEPDLAPFDEKAWAASRFTGRDALDELLTDFRLHREASLSILRRLDPNEWLRTGRQPEYGAFDIHWWLQHWAEHDDTHLAQVRDALDAR